MDCADLSQMDAACLAEAVSGLTSSPKTLPPKLFYDEEGCRLFGAITELPEYYLTRTERAILLDCRNELADHVPPHGALIEFGASNESKAELLFDALSTATYVPIDIAADALGLLRQRLQRRRPALRVLPIAADFTSAMNLPADLTDIPRLGFFPGSTIGNFAPAEAAEFLHRARAALGANAPLLIGFDLEKSPDILLPAYDDSAGVTADFNRNMLLRLNRDAGADFDPDQFAHRVIWNEEESRVEMHLQSRAAQRVRLAGRVIDFTAGETIHTENSYKYSITRFLALAAIAGWQRCEQWLDQDGLFALCLLH